MRALGVLLLVPVLGGAQTHASAGLVRGTVLECDTKTEGELSIRTADNQVLRYQFDHKTYAEREEHLIEASRIVPGEQVEVVSDSVPGSLLRYARTIHVIEPAPPPRQLSQGRLRAYNPKTDTVRTGNLTYSGVIYRLSPEHLMIHSKESGDLTIQLRKDTRYIADGQVVDAGDLKPNTRVFIRAGKDLYNDVEAYQVIWGKILTPQ
ncbi:MAG TPA: hypothetical protein VMH28_26975 [Candidatus Acidoferrales bacterium]|nr:hypothetical protein [Candidatus Acidoferrales bacterium]